MCYYISITPKLTDLQARFRAIFVQTESYQPVYSASAFTFPEIPVISNEDTDHIRYYRWGLIPFWVKDLTSAMAIRQKTLNARAETIFEKPSFRHAIRSKRCLIIADGFFEWRHEKRKTYPYYIRLTDHNPFSIAGIWDSWLNHDTGEIMKTCSVITTTANHLLERVHNTKKRMPVILRREDESRWLDGNLDEEKVRSMLRPYNANEMEANPVQRIVNKLGYNTADPQVLERFVYPELPEI